MRRWTTGARLSRLSCTLSGFPFIRLGLFYAGPLKPLTMNFPPVKGLGWLELAFKALNQRLFAV